MTTASTFLQASKADDEMVTFFLTEEKTCMFSILCQVCRKEALVSMGVKGTASARSAQTWACSTLGSYKLTMAFSARKSRKRVIAGDSRVSPVSALNANPRTAIRYRARQLHSHKRPKQTEGYFASDRVEKRVHHALREPPLLILIQLHDLSPVGCDFRQMKTFAEIHQVQDVLLEARSAEPKGSL